MMFSRTTPATTHQHNYSAPAESSRDHSLEPYPSLPIISYPESSQRTRMHHDQFHHMAPDAFTQKTYLRSSDTPFSPLPPPSDRPPPSLRLPSPPSFSNAIAPPVYSPSANHSSHGADASNYRGLSLSLSDSDDDLGYNSPYLHHPSNFIPM
jgi:hypothetical protein